MRRGGEGIEEGRGERGVLSMRCVLAGTSKATTNE